MCDRFCAACSRAARIQPEGELDPHTARWPLPEGESVARERHQREPQTQPLVPGLQPATVIVDLDAQFLVLDLGAHLYLAVAAAIRVHDRVGHRLRYRQSDSIQALVGSTGRGGYRGHRLPSSRDRIRNSRVTIAQIVVDSHGARISYPPLLGTNPDSGLWRRRWGLLAALLPLDRAGGLACDIQHNTAHLPDFADHPRRDLLEQVVGKPRPVRGHRII